MSDFDVSRFKIDADKTAILLIDVQEKLVGAMDHEEWNFTEESILNLVHLAGLLELPLLVTEQYPKGLGSTIPTIQEHLEGVEKIEKIEFSACANKDFMKHLEEKGITSDYSLIITGLEAHVCVYQTVLDFLEKGYKVFVPNDAVLSRHYEDFAAGIDLLERAGALATSTEMIIFQLLGKAGTPEFKEMSKRLK